MLLASQECYMLENHQMDSQHLLSPFLSTKQIEKEKKLLSR